MRFLDVFSIVIDIFFTISSSLQRAKVVIMAKYIWKSQIFQEPVNYLLHDYSNIELWGTKFFIYGLTFININLYLQN